MRTTDKTVTPPRRVEVRASPPKQASRKPIDLRLLPIGLAVLGLAFAGRSYLMMQDAGVLIASARAADTKPATKPAAKPAAPKAPAAVPATKPESRTEAQIEQEIAAKAQKKPPATGEDPVLRQRLLEATEKRLDGKLGELKGLEGNLKRLTGERQEQADKQFASLVKVYETMKAKDAARIFERLDLKVQQAVASKMKEQKMAAILAAMDPDKAKTLTMELASASIVAE